MDIECDVLDATLNQMLTTTMPADEKFVSDVVVINSAGPWFLAHDAFHGILCLFSSVPRFVPNFIAPAIRVIPSQVNTQIGRPTQISTKLGTYIPLMKI